MADILDYISTWSILQWVILVLIAGIISQFGKMIAQAVIGKIRNARLKKQTQKEPNSSPDIKTASAIASIEKDSMSQKRYPDKKALKIIMKERKKAAKKNK